MAFEYNGILPAVYHVKAAIIAESAFAQPDDISDAHWHLVLKAGLKGQKPEDFTPLQQEAYEMISIYLDPVELIKMKLPLEAGTTDQPTLGEIYDYFTAFIKAKIPYQFEIEIKPLLQTQAAKRLGEETAPAYRQLTSQEMILVATLVVWFNNYNFYSVDTLHELLNLTNKSDDQLREIQGVLGDTPTIVQRQIRDVVYTRVFSQAPNFQDAFYNFTTSYSNILKNRFALVDDLNPFTITGEAIDFEMITYLEKFEDVTTIHSILKSISENKRLAFLMYPRIFAVIKKMTISGAEIGIYLLAQLKNRADSLKFFSHQDIQEKVTGMSFSHQDLFYIFSSIDPLDQDKLFSLPNFRAKLDELTNFRTMWLILNHTSDLIKEDYLSNPKVQNNIDSAMPQADINMIRYLLECHPKNMRTGFAGKILRCETKLTTMENLRELQKILELIDDESSRIQVKNHFMSPLVDTHTFPVDLKGPSDMSLFLSLIDKDKVVAFMLHPKFIEKTKGYSLTALMNYFWDFPQTIKLKFLNLIKDQLQKGMSFKIFVQIIAELPIEDWDEALKLPGMLQILEQGLALTEPNSTLFDYNGLLYSWNAITYEKLLKFTQIPQVAEKLDSIKFIDFEFINWLKNVSTLEDRINVLKLPCIARCWHPSVGGLEEIKEMAIALDMAQDDFWDLGKIPGLEKFMVKKIAICITRYDEFETILNLYPDHVNQPDIVMHNLDIKHNDDNMLIKILDRAPQGPLRWNVLAFGYSRQLYTMISYSSEPNLNKIHSLLDIKYATDHALKWVLGARLEGYRIKNQPLFWDYADQFPAWMNSSRQNTAQWVRSFICTADQYPTYEAYYNAIANAHSTFKQSQLFCLPGAHDEFDQILTSFDPKLRNPARAKNISPSRID